MCVPGQNPSQEQRAAALAHGARADAEPPSALRRRPQAYPLRWTDRLAAPFKLVPRRNLAIALLGLLAGAVAILGLLLADRTAGSSN